MFETLLATKLYIPPAQPRAVTRPRIIERLDEGQQHKLTLVSAPAGFGKTTAVSAWVAECGQPVAWLSLDERDSDPIRFLTYLVAALQTVAADVGQGIASALQAPQPPPVDAIVTALLNDIARVPERFVLVLDDYHVVDSHAVDDALTFLLDHLPPRMHLLITTREDPRLPLARLRVRGELTELRAADLRFSPAEAAAFLNDVMGLSLAESDIAALETRTEGWIAGLQLAAISMRGHADTSGFIASFTGSHRFVLDYLVQEVLHQQPQHVQEFLLRTSILDRLCGPLCDAVVGDASADGRATLEYLERINLFVVPLDDERRWYRYHHLFAELLRQQLQQRSAAPTGSASAEITECHTRASAWFETQGFEIEAFQHAAAANDVARAERLANGKGIPLYLRGGLAQILAWLDALPPAVLHASPSLCVLFASAFSVGGHLSRVDPLVKAAEAALPVGADDDTTRDLIGRIAGLRALLALLAGDASQRATIIEQSERALEYLHPDNLHVRTATTWRLGLAYEQQGNRAAARATFDEAIALCERAGNTHINILATTCLGRVQESNLQIQPAVATYRRVLQLIGEPPGPVACEAYLCLARIHYEWNDLETARKYGELSVTLARQIELSNFISCELFVARLQLAEGDTTGALAAIAASEQTVQQRKFWARIPELVTLQVRALLLHGDLTTATRLTDEHDLPLSRARVLLAQGDATAALAVLGAVRQRAETQNWPDERLKALVLEAVAHQTLGDLDASLCVLSDALTLAEPTSFIRTFIDEGPPMIELLSAARERGIRPDYIGRLLAAMSVDAPTSAEPAPHATPQSTQPLIEPLSRRELEVLGLIAQGLSNREIGERLFLALDTVKGHNRVIFGKLQVQRRTEAIARARELGLL